MRPHVLGIDHVVILVHDLDKACDAYSRMGFTLTPRGYHTLGSQNHCIMFGSDYVELLAMTKTHPAMQYFTDFLAKGEGLAGIALATDDVAGAHAGLARAGVPADAPMEFSRPVELPGGTRDAAFKVVQLPVSLTAGTRLFFCQHYTRDVVWRPDCLAHDVGASSIAAIAIVVDDPTVAARSYASVFDEQPHRIAEGLLVNTGTAPIALTTRGSLGTRLDGAALPLRPRPLVGALFIRVADRGHAAQVLRKGGYSPVAMKDGSFAIGADEAHGVTLVFG
jgi:catechol 2,3-dioxygenase-like lactoylglutathione lyase family enzyme